MLQSLLENIRNWKSNFLIIIGFRNHLLLFFLASHSLFSQATIPILQLSQYDTNLMNDVYGQSYFMNSVAAWTDQVSYYQGLIRAAWENSADQAINQYVDSITTSDAYNDVNAYKDYVSKELFSQKEEALITWEDSANFDLLQNRNEFIAKLNSNRVNESYLERIGMQNSIRPADATTTADILRQDIISSASTWQYRFNESFQTGLNDFSGSLEEIENKYNTFLNSMNASDQQFQNNLQAIDVYKGEVKNAIRGTVTQFEGMLAASCNTADNCAYKFGNNGGLNPAGQMLQGLVTRLNAVLNDNTISPTNLMTTISTEIQTFLTSQTSTAQSNYQDFDARINTRQFYGASPTVYGVGGGYTRDTIYDPGRSLGDLSPSNVRSWDKDDASGRFSGVKDSGFQAILNAILSGDNKNITDILNPTLGGRTATIVASNIYTDWDNGKNTITVAGGHALGYVAAYHKQGNYHLEVTKEDTFYWLANRGFIDREQMGKIGFEILYDLNDPNAQAQSTYWHGNYTALNGQLTQYTNNIIPAIKNWESQVQSYNTFYENWKTQADVMKADAKANYDASIADINTKKAKWLLQMEDERHSALIKWNDLYDEAGNVQNASDVSRLSNSINGTYTSSISNVNISTNLGSTANNYAAYLENLSSRELTGVSSSSGTNYTVLGAADQNKIDIRLQINGKELSEVFGKTTNGIYQFSQLISINGNNALAAKEEQEKLVNQMAWSVNWEKRVAAKIDANGNLQLDKEIAGISSADIKTMLEKLAKYSYKGEQATGVCILGTSDYTECTDRQKKLNDQKKEDFESKFSVELEQLKKRDLEFQNGMIVKSLTANEKNLLGIKDETAPQRDPNTPLTAAEKAAALTFGSCYKNPTSCAVDLQQDFQIEYDKAGGVVLSRKINNGRVEGRNANGYTSGEQVESRFVSLSKVNPVTAPKGKDLFDVWGESDWTDVETQATAVMTAFGTALNKDAKALAQTTAIIRNTESLNEAKFQREKKAREEQDSLIRDLAIAYLTGGAAGVRGAIKSKVEETINLNLATAWAKASGADDDQIGLLTNAIGFMKGKMTERKLKSQQATNNLQNAGTALVATAAAFGNSLVQFGTSLVALKSGNFAAAGTAFVGGVQSLGQGFTSMGQAAAALTATSQGMLATGLYLGGGNTILTGTAIGAYREIAGDAAADNVNRQITGTQTRINEIKAQRESMLQSTVTTAAAKATGLPAEVIGNMLTDYKGKKEAAAVRAAVNANPIAGVTSYVTSTALGVYKTAVVAMGVPDRRIAQAMAEGNAIVFNGINDKRLQQANLAYASQALGMKAPGTSYVSSTPSDERGIVKELGQRMLVDQLSAGMSAEEKAVLNAAIRGQVGKIEQKRADQKAQTAAIRSTAITLATLGIGAQFNSLSAAQQALFKGSEKLFKASVNLVVQTVDGSRNGPEGVFAGLTNGAIGMLTANGNLTLPKEITRPGMQVFQGATIGLGVSYDRQAGWGGMVGVGGDRTNASLSFSQHGDTTVNGSAQTHIEGVQLTGSSTTNGSTTVGIAYNPSNEGPRRGENYSINYDTDNGQFSGSAGYTDPTRGIGFTTNIDAHGASITTQNNGVNIATVSADGFQYDDYNWAEQNINLAQDRTGDAERAQATENYLKSKGYDKSVIDKMSPTERDNLQQKLVEKDHYDFLKENGYRTDTLDSMTPELRALAVDQVNERLREAQAQDSTVAAMLGVVGSFSIGSMLALFGYRRPEDDLPRVGTNPQVLGDGNGTNPLREKLAEKIADIEKIASDRKRELQTQIDDPSTASAERTLLKKQIATLEAEKNNIIKKAKIEALIPVPNTRDLIPKIGDHTIDTDTRNAKLIELNAKAKEVQENIAKQIDEAKAIDPKDPVIKEYIKSLEEQKKIAERTERAQEARIRRLESNPIPPADQPRRIEFSSPKAISYDVRIPNDTQFKNMKDLADTYKSRDKNPEYVSIKESVNAKIEALPEVKAYRKSQEAVSDALKIYTSYAESYARGGLPSDVATKLLKNIEDTFVKPAQAEFQKYQQAGERVLATKDIEIKRSWLEKNGIHANNLDNATILKMDATFGNKTTSLEQMNHYIAQWNKDGYIKNSDQFVTIAQKPAEAIVFKPGDKQGELSEVRTKVTDPDGQERTITTRWPIDVSKRGLNITSPLDLDGRTLPVTDPTKKNVHDGNDIGKVPVGTPFGSVGGTSDTPGTVISVSPDTDSSFATMEDGGRSYGANVVVQYKLADGRVVNVTYAHLSNVNVVKPQQVVQGDLIGLSGNSGRSEKPHLHYKIEVQNSPSSGFQTVDPSTFDWGTN